MSASGGVSSEPLTADILEALAAVVVVDTDGQVVYATEAAATLVGTTIEAARQRPVLEFFPERLRDSVARSFVRYVEEGGDLDGRRIQLPLLHRSGEEVVVDVVVSPRRAPGGHVVVTIEPVDHARLTDADLLERLSRDRPLPEALEDLVATVGADLGWAAGSCWMAAAVDDDQVLRPVATWTAGPELKGYVAATHAVRFSPGEGPVGRAWAARDAEWITDPAADPRFRPGRPGTADLPVVGTGLAFPLVDDQGAVAVVELYAVGDRRDELWLEAELQALTSGLAPVVRRRAIEHDAAERHRQLELALEAGQMGVWSWEVGTGRVRWSAQMERLCGLEPGTFGGTVDDYWAVVHPDDREHTERILLESLQHRVPRQVRHRIVLPSGEVRWIEGMGRAVGAADQEPVAMIGVALDVTARERVTEHLRREARVVELLHQVGQVVSSSLDLASAVQEVTDAAVRLTHARFGAYFCVVGDEVEPGRMSLVALSGLPRHLLTGLPAPRRTPLLDATLGGGETVRLDDVTADARFGGGLPEGHLPVCSYLAVPVVAPVGGLVGGLLLGHEQPGVFTADDERIATGIASQAGIAIDNARRFEQQRRDVLALQESLLPGELPSFPDLAVAARYIPGAPGTTVGGDWYDALDLGDGWVGLAVGDVCGHGMAAAAAMAQLRHGLAAVLLTTADAGDALSALNRLARERLRTTVTMAFIRVHRDSGRFQVWSAGHLPPLVVGPDHCAFVELAGDPLLGVHDDLLLRPVDGALAPGQALVLFTDGLIERRGEVLDEGLARLAGAAADLAAAGAGAAELCEGLHLRVGAGVDHPDDAALLVAARPTATGAGLGPAPG